MRPITRERIFVAVLFLLGIYAIGNAIIDVENAVFWLFLASPFVVAALTILCRQMGNHYLWSSRHVSSLSSVRKGVWILAVTMVLQVSLILYCIALAGILAIDLATDGDSLNIVLIVAAGLAGVQVGNAILRTFHDIQVGRSRLSEPSQDDLTTEDDSDSFDE